MNKNVDIVVIGAGIIGLNIAFQIARRSKMSVLVLEMAPSLGHGSSGASSAVCRHRYSYDETLILARDGINAYRRWGEYLDHDRPFAQYQQDGVLWLTTDETAWGPSEVARLRRLQVAAELLPAAEIRYRFPAVNTCSISPDTTHGEHHDCNSQSPAMFENLGGYFDPNNALTDLTQALGRHGVSICFNQRVAKVLQQSGQTTGVQLQDATTIHSNLVINASGPWCNTILTDLGMATRWNLQPTRIQMIHLERPAEVKGHIPVCCDIAGGIYFRTQNRGQQIVLGSTREEDERETIEPDQLPTYIDDDFRDTCLHALHHRLPALPYTGRVKGYCGLYTVNQLDVHPVVGETPLAGFYVANGFSGHGFKLAPAIGSLLAQQVTGLTTSFDTEVSPEFLSFARQPLHLDNKNVLA